MYKKEITIGNKFNASTFPVPQVIEIAKRFSSAITIQKGDLEIDGASLLGMLSLKLSSGMKITLIGKGKDEKKAIEALVNYLT